MFGTWYRVNVEVCLSQPAGYLTCDLQSDFNTLVQDKDLETPLMASKFKTLSVSVMCDRFK